MVKVDRDNVARAPPQKLGVLSMFLSRNSLIKEVNAFLLPDLEYLLLGWLLSDPFSMPPTLNMGAMVMLVSP